LQTYQPQRERDGEIQTLRLINPREMRGSDPADFHYAWIWSRR
jgi:hypothetical protein